MKNKPSLKELRRIFTVIFFIVFPLLIFQCTMPDRISSEEYARLIDDFVVPHDTNVVWCYYYWINDDISKEGVTHDMEAMKEFGIGGVLIGNINRISADGPVPLFSDEWWDITVHTVNEGHRLGIEVGFFNCPGWSQSGGPWIGHEQAMRYLVYTETQLQGPLPAGSVMLERPVPTPRTNNYRTILPGPEEYQDTYTLAFHTIEAESRMLDQHNARISAIPAIEGIHHVLDGNTSTEALLDASAGAGYTIDIVANEAITARSVVIHPAQPRINCHIELQANIDGEFKSIQTFAFDRSNPRVNVGPVSHGPVSVALPETTASEFRLLVNRFSGAPGMAGFSQIIITEAQVLADYVEKSLGRMHPTPLPDFDSYLWDSQPELGRNELVINQVVDVSQYMDEHGVLQWEVPEGNWTILRMGMTPTGTENHPASPHGKGYEVDKANEELARYHFEQFMGEIIRRVPKESLPALKYLIADSYEMGPQNWTDGFQQRFEEKFGYSPVKYLPVFSGRIVGSVAESDRFLWDLRRAIADDVAYEYVGGLRKIANEHGLKLWLENYGHWGFPSEFLMYGGQSDLVAGEYWNEGNLGDIECKAASSAAHIYGKPFVSAETWTSSGLAYLRHPAMLKRRGDWSLTEGINHHVLHVYIQQPDNDRVPGVNEWFGTEFNRHNTWFDQGRMWVDYLRRCQHLLQQGHYVADVLYFIGEDAPKMSGTQDPELPSGYSYDYVNAEVILQRLSVKDGRLVLPDGMNYGLLVLPQSNTMRPEVLEKIEELVRQGAYVFGPAPEESPSLQGFPGSDESVKQLAARMWVEPEYEAGRLIREHGKGYIMDGIELQEALDVADIPKDLVFEDELPVLWTHRSKEGMDVYFLTNQGSEPIFFTPSFRVSDRVPQLWDPVSGEIRMLNEYNESGGHTALPLKMEPLQSWFVVFTGKVDQRVNRGYVKNFPDPKTIANIEGSWVVEFVNKNIGPESPVLMTHLEDWTNSSDEKIRHYSGTALYRTTFVVEEIPEAGDLYLNLGDVGVMARAKINGQELGGAWIYPFRIPIGNMLLVGENSLEVEVVNTWRNRLIKDAGLPREQRYTWVNTSDVTPETPLQASGLKGPVTVEWVYSE